MKVASVWAGGVCPSVAVYVPVVAVRVTGTSLTVTDVLLAAVLPLPASVTVTANTPLVVSP